MRKIIIEIIPEVEETAHEKMSDENIIADFFGKCLSGYKWKVLPQANVIKSVCDGCDSFAIRKENGVFECKKCGRLVD